MNTNLIYAHRKVTDNSIFYIGIGTETRANELTGKGRRSEFWMKTAKKYGVVVDILKRDLSRDDANQLEKDLISYYGRRDNGTGILVNMTDGGDGGLTYSKRVFDTATGIEYNSIAEGSRALGLNTKTVSQKINGVQFMTDDCTLRFIENQPKIKTGVKKKGPARVLNTLNGKVYKTIVEASEDLGCSYDDVRYAIRRIKAGKIYRGKLKHLRYE